MTKAKLTALVVMGVSGSGKSTVGALLGERLGWPYRDADSFHPPANIAKMSAGLPLADEDRWPWLAAIAAWLAQLRAEGRQGVVSCSGLKRVYRDRIRDAHGDVRFVYLDGTFDMIAARLASREHHFFPPALLKSQFEALEPPGEDEAIRVSVALEPSAIVDEAVRLSGV